MVRQYLQLLYSVQLIYILQYTFSNNKSIQILIQMIKLNDIKFQASKSLFHIVNHKERSKSKQKTGYLPLKKQLRISMQHITRRTSSSGKITNQNCITWTQEIQLPILYEKQFDFQIFNDHNFGYNPEELSEIYTGKLIIENIKQKQGVWQVYMHGTNLQIGFLTASIFCTPTIRPQNQIVTSNKTAGKASTDYVTQPRVIKVRNIIGTLYLTQHIFPSPKISQFGYNQKQDSISQKQRAVEVQQAKSYSLSNSNFSSQSLVTIQDSYDTILGQGQLIFAQNLYKKVILENPSTKQQVGQLYFNYRLFALDPNITTKGNKIIEKYNEKIYKAGILQIHNRIKLEKQIKKEQNRVQRIKRESKYLVFNNNEDNWRYGKLQKAKQSVDLEVVPEYHSPKISRVIESRLSPLMSNSQSMSISRKKLSPNSTNNSQDKRRSYQQFSVVNSNNRICIPQSPRFPVEKTSSQFNYTLNRHLQFDKTQYSMGRYYRGAGFGKGYKTDFAKLSEKSPGVGLYCLPTIWDRYQ